MASDGDIRIDLRGDGRVILYKRDNLKDPVWQARIRVPNSTGYKRITTKTSDQREAERFALNYYEGCCQSNRNSSPIGGAVALSARA